MKPCNHSLFLCGLVPFVLFRAHQLNAIVMTELPSSRAVVYDGEMICGLQNKLVLIVLTFI